MRKPKYGNYKVFWIRLHEHIYYILVSKTSIHNILHSLWVNIQCIRRVWNLYKGFDSRGNSCVLCTWKCMEVERVWSSCLHSILSLILAFKTTVKHCGFLVIVIISFLWRYYEYFYKGIWLLYIISIWWLC